MRNAFISLASSGVAGTISAVTSLYDLSRKFGNSGAIAADMEKQETRTLAKAAIVMDITSVGAQIVSTLIPKAVHVKAAFAGAAKTAATTLHASQAARAANTASVVLQVGSGVVEFEIARRNGDATRASDAIGNTFGGLGGGLGGAKLGAIIGTVIMPGPGTAILGFTGAVAGSWGGSKLGRGCADYAVRDWLHRKFV